MIIPDLSDKNAEQVIAWTQKTFGDDWLLASSFGIEDVCLIDLIDTAGIKPHVFFLDTGRLHEETYTTVDTIRSRYKLDLTIYFPHAEDLQVLLEMDHYGSIFDSKLQRRACCNARKVQPLKRALAHTKAWMTGLRSEQALTRGEMQKVEKDPMHPGLFKINPLIDWTTEQVWAYAKRRQLPYNSLHDKGYPSIGCAPCTRAISANEHIRAGRWWWEEQNNRECGLHR